MRAQLRIEGHSHRAETHGAKEAGGEFGRVVEQQRHPLLHLHAQRAEAVARAVRLFRQLGVRHHLCLRADGGAIAPSLRERAVEKRGGDVILFWQVLCGVACCAG